MAEALIDRLKRRVQTEPWIDMQHLADIRPQPPVSPVELAAAEGQLGFELPALVRDLYTHVADGGYGPGYGLARLPEFVQRGREFAEAGAAGPWPARFLHLCWWGCEYFSGLDCSAAVGPVLRFVPDDWTDEALVREADSLEEWLEAWLNGERLWDRVRPEQ
jgi:hypothetical protein